MKITDKNFFTQSAVDLAKALLGKLLCRKIGNNIFKYRITETEAYVESDTACHAHNGKTERNKILWEEGGTIYVYLCYGIHYLMNIISGEKGTAEGVLLRGVENFYGPGRLTKNLMIDKTFNGENILSCTDMWIEDDNFLACYTQNARIGIDYASKEDREKPWRFTLKGN